MDRRRLEIWAGIEPSVVRIGDEYVDQVRNTGHHERLDDLDFLAGLGIQTVRYPVLWERVAPEGIAKADWRWADERLQRLAELRIDPVLTLLHHGSGPRGTSLLDPDFPTKLATYARAVAKRYPWVRRFTPINEPLTTARFSALYGLWYPHERDAVSFVTALLNQLEGIARSIAAIREEIPSAQLVQTEDLGKVHSTPELSYQARFENERRWMSTDLLCGALDRSDLVTAWLRQIGFGLTSVDLERYRCEPDILGFNYYVTGERFLDHRVDRYPNVSVGGNNRHNYVDLEAVRVRAEGIEGLGGLLGEAWQRYERPLAVTELHLGCTREQQIRWLEEGYRDVTRLRATGVDIRALTVWAAFGSCDWDSLLTSTAGHYEAGCFDVSDRTPRETLIAGWTRARAADVGFEHPVLNGEGWWRSPLRLRHGAASRGGPAGTARARQTRATIAIVGTTLVASRCIEACRERLIEAIHIPQALTVADLAQQISRIQAWIVIDADSGFGSVVAKAAHVAGVKLLVLSGASTEWLQEPEIAALLATGTPLIARFGDQLDMDRWLGRALDLAMDGAQGLWESRRDPPLAAEAS